MKLHFTFGKDSAKDAFESCVRLYGQSLLHSASAHVVLGGDGTTLDALRSQAEQGVDIPIFALNYGTLGWLTNHKDWEDLPDRILRSKQLPITPLKADITTFLNGKKITAYAFNEFSFFRGPSMQAVDLNVVTPQWQQNVRGDGVIVSTPLGSNAYLKSAGGPQLMPGASVMAIQTNNALHPFSKIISSDEAVGFSVHQHEKRPVRIECDSKLAIDNVSHAVVRVAKNRVQTLLFDRIERKRD